MFERKGRILCVDDEPKALSLRQKCLETRGHTVFTAGTWESTLRRIRENDPIHVVILDYQLERKVTGAMIAEDLSVRYPDIRRIMLSGLAEELGKDLVHAWVPKGDILELFEAVNRLLERRAFARGA